MKEEVKEKLVGEGVDFERIRRICRSLIFSRNYEKGVTLV